MKHSSLWSKYREPITYLVFGVLTTVVNYIVYFLTTRGLSMHYMEATVLSWAAAVTFAYFTNRKWVFQSTAQRGAEKRIEFVKFVGGRVLSLLLEAVIMFTGIELFHLGHYDWAVKTVAQVGVVVSNYFLSKFLVFK
ncbi:MAG: GtrA family protein [Peptoniphilaceae bacterium]|nr:GtrA family protein [Peptoniphilaceae bacterium]MDY6085874.1 GtrA family protein [Peptoniphilaceae bacterium]